MDVTIELGAREPSLVWAPAGFLVWEVGIVTHISQNLTDSTCPSLCDPLDCSSPGSLIPGISHRKALEWVSISYAKGSSWPRDRTGVSWVAGRFLTLSLRGLNISCNLSNIVLKVSSRMVVWVQNSCVSIIYSCDCVADQELWFSGNVHL